MFRKCLLLKGYLKTKKTGFEPKLIFFFLVGIESWTQGFDLVCSITRVTPSLIFAFFFFFFCRGRKDFICRKFSWRKDLLSFLDGVSGVCLPRPWSFWITGFITMIICWDGFSITFCLCWPWTTIPDL
jgi:hypothetical protein